jgi:hypothetical protein
MKESGILDVELQHAMPKETVCEIDQFSKINILDVAPALILLGVGMGIALFILALEVAWYWRGKKVHQVDDILNQGVLYFQEFKKITPVNKTNFSKPKF